MIFHSSLLLIIQEVGGGTNIYIAFKRFFLQIGSADVDFSDADFVIGS